MVNSKGSKKIMIPEEKLSALARLASVGEAAAGIAHEINNPLSIIQGYARKLQFKSKKGEVSSSEVDESAKQIFATVARIQDIVHGLMEFSRDGSEDLKIDHSIAGILRETIQFCEEKFKSSFVTLEPEYPDPNLLCECNRIQVSQILVNLLNNSHHAVLEKDQDNKWVEVRVDCTDDKVIFKVIDSGDGIPDELREKVFDSFFSTKKIGQGTGLGLSISKKIAEAHGGRLYLDEKSNTTCFCLELPRKQSKSGFNEVA